MATWYSQSSGLASTLARWNDASGGGGNTPTNITDLDNDSITIQAGHTIDWDIDTSGWTNGLQTFTITGHASDTDGVGTLRLDSTTVSAGTYYIKMMAGYSIVGTNATHYGRVLANSDGIWSGTGSLAFDRKFIIEFLGTAAGCLNCQYLNVNLRCSQPEVFYTRTYGTKHRVTGSASADTLTKSSHGLANNTMVKIMVAAGGSLPSPLEEDTMYFVSNTATDTFKLAKIYGGTAIDLTTDGSGDIDVYTGHTNTSTAVVNVLDNVTTDSCWSSTAGHDVVALINQYTQTSTNGTAPIHQRTTISSIDSASQITLADNVANSQAPGSRIYLSSRNISLRTNTTSTSYTTPSPVGNSTWAGNNTSLVFQCELRSLACGASSHYGVHSGYKTVLSGTMYGLYGILMSGGGCTVSGIAIYCGYLDAGAPGANIFSGTVAGGIQQMSWNNYSSISGLMYGIGGSYAFSPCNAKCTGLTIQGCVYGIGAKESYFDKDCVVKNCFYGVLASPNSVFSGRITGCYYDFYFSNNSKTILRNVLVDFSDTVAPNSYSRNSTPYFGAFYCENLNRGSSQMVFDCFGTLERVACDGTGDQPSVDPDGGNGYCVEATSLSYCGFSGSCQLRIIHEMRVWLTAGEHTVAFKIQNNFTTSADMKLYVRYIGAAGALITATTSSSVTARANDSDWTNTIATSSFTTSEAGWVSIDLDLLDYESGKIVYVWPNPTIT